MQRIELQFKNYRFLNTDMRTFNSFEEIPKKDIGKPRLTKGEIIIVFASMAEFEAYCAGLEQIFNKDALIGKISQLHTELFIRIWSTNEFIPAPYESREELNSAMSTPDSDYFAEAIAINQWYWNTWKIIEQYAESVTEETAIAPKAFIENLPSFSFGES